MPDQLMRTILGAVCFGLIAGLSYTWLAPFGTIREVMMVAAAFGAFVGFAWRR